MKYISRSHEQTVEFAEKMASKLENGDVLLLSGDLGAGKTTFVQGLAIGLGVSDDAYVRSPTFTLINVYEGGRKKLYHADLYRMASQDELYDIGMDEYIRGTGIMVVEWADRFPDFFPPDSISIGLRFVSEDVREIEVFAPEGRENIYEI